MVMKKRTRATSAAVGSAEFKARCLEFIDRVNESRAEYVVTRHGRPVAKLVPVDNEAPLSPLGSMRGTLLEYERPFDPIAAAWSFDRADET
jgi:prevent-host-death family protein